MIGKKNGDVLYPEEFVDDDAMWSKPATLCEGDATPCEGVTADGREAPCQFTAARWAQR